ncbi:MAG: PAS domain S-box protein [Deltaproteobacteria bacterium]|nr:PAS domain S-box protein [Deltaproteobacteria bacterium]
MARAQILVADSDPGFAVGLAANLESLGYAVTEVVSSPEEALIKAEETRPDLVLLDMGLLRDGKKKAPQDLRKRIPNLVYLVGEEDRKTLQQAKITFSFDYLRKAYDSRELETIIDMALYRRKLEGESRRDQEKQRQVRQKWQQRDKKQTAKIGKITAELKSESDRHQRLEDALQAERKKLFAVLDTLPAYVALLAPDYSMPYTNREFEKRFGAPEGRKCYEFLFGRTSPCPDCETYKVLDTNAPHEWEWTGPDGRDYQIYDFPFPDTDGSPLILEMGVNVTVLKEKEAQISKMAAALRRSYEELEARVQDRTQELAQSNAALQNEIAERLWSEKKLKESEERYRLLVDLSPDAIAVYSQGELVFINPAGAQLFGANHYRELVGKPALDLIHPEHRDMVKRRLRRLTAEGGRTKVREIKILRLDGQVVDVEASGVGIAYQGQLAVQVVLRDITARKRTEQELKRLASFPRLNPNPVLEADASGKITFVNAAALNALEKLDLENQVKAFLPPDLDKIIKTAAETGITVFYREVEINGAYFGETISFPREFRVIRIYARDITLQKRAEMERQELLEKLQASEEELQVINEELQVQNEELQTQAEELLASNQNLTEAHDALRESREDLNRAQAVAHTGSWRLDVRQNELLWSDETYRIFGISQGTPLTYEAFLAAVHPEDRAYVDRKWMVALRGEPYDLEHRIVVGNTVKWVSEKAELEFDLQGRLLAGFGTVQDITERKRSEEALKESESRYRSLFQNNQAVMLLIDSETGEILDANPAACSFYDYSQKELTAKQITDFNIASQEGVFQEMRRVTAGEESHFFFKHRLASGDVRDVEVYSSPLQVRGRRLLYSIIHDNTARKEAEETLKASRDFLEIANRHTRMAPLLKDFAAAVKEHAGCEAVAIRILDEQGRIPYEAYEGFPPEFIACESSLSIHSDQCLCINVCKGSWFFLLYQQVFPPFGHHPPGTAGGNPQCLPPIRV